MIRRAASWARRHKGAIGYLILAGAVALARTLVIQLANTNRTVLCALEADIERRRDRAVLYLEQHPLGVIQPSTGEVIITAAELQRTIASQTSTLQALERGGLHCG